MAVCLLIRVWLSYFSQRVQWRCFNEYGCCVSVRAAINRCLSNNKETITLACPDGHVIFQPEVRQGLSGWQRRCHGETGDCRGMTHTLVVQQNQCHWLPQCQLSWRNRVPILVSDQPQCLAGSPDYVEMRGAQCLPQGQK